MLEYNITVFQYFVEYQIGQSHQQFRDHHQPPKPPQQSKDDAYADFMKEMSGLL